MAWDRLKLMVALVVVAFLALLVLMNRLDPGRGAFSLRRARWRWPGSKKKVALVMTAVLALVVVVNHLDKGATPKERVIIERVISQCINEQGRSVPLPWERLKGEGTAFGKSVGERTIFLDDQGNEISCTGLLGFQRPGG
jgi:hypothetical protein